jgi:phage replication O-like protein O
MAAEALAVKPAANVINIEHRRSEYMGNPQLDEGHTRIANELLEAILSHGFTGRQLQIIFAVIRKTYGYNKKADEIGLSQFRDLTGIARQHVSKALQDLAAMNVLNIDAGTHAHRISLNKKYGSWVSPKEALSPNREQSPIQARGITESVQKVSPNRAPQNTIQKTTPKDKAQAPIPTPDFGGQEVQKAWAEFVSHRLETKKPLTARAAVLNINVLRKADADGFCCVALIHKAIANSWRGIFEPKAGDKRKADAAKPGVKSPFLGAV